MYLFNEYKIATMKYNIPLGIVEAAVLCEVVVGFVVKRLYVLFCFNDVPKSIISIKQRGYVRIGIKLFLII